MTRDEESVRCMEQTRDYYRALGYAADYDWATYAEVPFARLGKPLREVRIGLLTTAHPPDRSNQDALGIRHVWSGHVDPLPTLNTDDLAWDRESTHTEDRESFMPIEAVAGWVREGLVGGLAARFHGVPTEEPAAGVRAVVIRSRGRCA